MGVTVINKKPLLTAQSVRVRSAPEDGEMVVLRFPNGELGLHFEEALQLAGMIARQARVAYDRKITLTGSALGPPLRESWGRLT